MRVSVLVRAVCLLGVVLWSGCGSNSRPGSAPSSSSTPKIYLVVLENHSYSQMVGSSDMPFLNSLIDSKSTADNFFANTHPSIGNYFMLTTGQTITNDDSFSGTVSADNLVRELTAVNRTWHVYAESLPSVGYTGGDIGPYAKRHNPFAYFSDVVGTSQAQNMVPFAQFASDVSSNGTADFNYVLPNQNNNMHDCPAGMSSCSDDDKMKAADNWLRNNLAAVFNSSDFQARGLLIITMDESITSDTAHGGGHIVTVLAGPKAKDAHRSNVLYQHQSTLRLICDLLGCPTRPGASGSAPPMNEFVK